jgi:hypothetical protein
MSSVVERVMTAIEAYVDHRISLDELQSELIDVTWDNASPPDLALEAELLIAEGTRGQASADELATALAAAVKRAQRQYA